THVNVRIKLHNGPIYPHAGLSDFLDVQVDPTTDTVTVRATVPNPDGLLTAGGVVGVTVERGAPRSALTVPQAAVLLDQAGRYVLVVDAEKKVEQRSVTLGAEQGRNVVVTDGLKSGQQPSRRHESVPRISINWGHIGPLSNSIAVGFTLIVVSNLSPRTGFR